MRGTVVGILRGGPSREHEVSLRSGHSILSVLPREKYTVRDIYIDKKGIWHERGLITKPSSVLPTLDVAVIALHGEYGEDGEVQKLLETFGIPYTGSGAFSSFEAMHKVISKEKAREAGIQVAKYEFIEREEDINSVVHNVTRTYPQPVIVKPPRWGSSVGVTAPTGYQPVHQAVTGLFKENAGGAIIEEFIRGTEACVGVVENMRGEDLYVLPPVELVIPASEPFYTYNAKYSGQTKEIAPGRFSKAITLQLQDHARRMHQELKLRHYSRSDFIVSPKGIFYLETNTLPGLTATSSLPKALASVGIGFTEFIEHLIALALGHGKR
jgi:D-alanine-D-alanine ligase